MKQILSIRYTVILLCIFLSTSLAAQVKTRIFDNKVTANLLPLQSTDVNELILKAPVVLDNLLSLKKANNDSSIEYDNRFAIPQSVNINFLNSAKINEDKNYLFYYLTIKAEKALNISAHFKDFNLSKKAVLSIYTENEITDSVTAKENNENKIWATRVYQNNILNFVLKIPKSEKGLSNFTITQIGFGYKSYGAQFFGSPGASASCNINVLCSQGNGWQNERNAVALLLVADGAGTCTGSLIMNTCNTNSPYVLTANHCLEGNLNNWVFQYQYWSTTCTPNSGWHDDIQFNGCALRANNATSDFALVQMNQTPSTGSGITYAGWNRSAVPATNTVEIHHPASDLMKISLDANPPVAISWPGIPGLTHWRAHFQQGTVQPGSSGSPLFDQNHRIIGQCHGDQNNAGNYCAQQISECGRFDLSWVGGGTNATRLSNWLDPTGTNAVTTNTTNVSSLLPPSLQVSVSQTGCSSATATVNLASGHSFNWSVSGDLLIDGISSTKTTTNNFIDFIGTHGSAHVTITNCGTTIEGGADYSPYIRQIDGLFEVYSNGDQVSVSVNTTPYDSYYEWYINGVLDYQGADAYNYCTCKSDAGRNIVCGDNTIRVDVTACGVVSSSDELHFNKMGNCSFRSISASNMELFPNPAKGSVTVRMKQINAQNNTNHLQDIREIRIFDKLGNIKKVIKFPKNTKVSTLNINYLNTDIYFIEVSDGKNKARLQLSIQN